VNTLWQVLFWVYVVEASLLIAHEIDSAYWREWELFRLPGGPSLFVLVHVPLAVVVLVGLVLVRTHHIGGLALSGLVSAAGIGGFAVHAVFLKRGHREFATPASFGLLAAMLIGGLVQLVLTAALFAG
jgi:hypothetical protein